MWTPLSESPWYFRSPMPYFVRGSGSEVDSAFGPVVDAEAFVVAFVFVGTDHRSSFGSCPSRRELHRRLRNSLGGGKCSALRGRRACRGILGLGSIDAPVGESLLHGHITEVGNRQARGLVTQGAQPLRVIPGRSARSSERLTKRNIGAWRFRPWRKLVSIAYLRCSRTTNRTATLIPTSWEKLAKLKNIKPRAGARRTTKQPPPTLVTVFHAARLPPVREPEQLSGGERRMLAERKLEPYVDGCIDPSTDKKTDRVAVQGSAAPAARKGGRADRFSYWYERGRRTSSAYLLVLINRRGIVKTPGQGRIEPC